MVGEIPDGADLATGAPCEPNVRLPTELGKQIAEELDRQSASWAPTKMAWSHDNRTVGFRVVGQGNSFRIENRMPGADANPYLAFAAMMAAGLAGIEEQLDCGQEYHGNAYVDAG